MTADPSSPDGAPPTTASAAILLVDDTAAKRLSLRAVLTSLGHEIVEADSGQAALRCLLQRQFAVILLDVRMPLMNGFETAAFIRQRRESEFTPIIFVTAYELPDDDRANPLVAGAVDFITMPVNPEELRAKVSVFVNLFIESQAVESKFQSAHAEVDNWRVLLDNIPIGIFRTDDELRVLYTNTDWSVLTGLCAGAAYGRTPQDLLGVAAFADRGPGDDDVDQEVRITSPDAPDRVLRMTSRHLPADIDGPAGWVGTLVAVTAAPERPAHSADDTAKDPADDRADDRADDSADDEVVR